MLVFEPTLAGRSPSVAKYSVFRLSPTLARVQASTEQDFFGTQAQYENHALDFHLARHRLNENHHLLGGASYSIDNNFYVGASTSNIQFNKFQRAGNTLFVSTANGGNSSSASPKDPGLTRIYKRNLSATAAGIENNKKLINFSLAPNPGASFVMIEGLDSKYISGISIFSIGGKLMKTIQQSQLNIDIADLNAGIYIVKIETSNGQSGVAKFIK